MQIARASDLLRVAPARPLVPSPAEFCGTLEELWRDYIVPNLSEPAVVADFHRALVDYLREHSALLLVRHVRGMERRADYLTTDGTRLRATDNAPSWWVHYALFQGCRIAPSEFAQVVATVPTHLFDVARTIPTSASAAGWHIAHLFAVKDGRTDFRAWHWRDAVARFIRNVHPCNHGFVPKPEWQRWGGDARVLGYFAAQFARRYASVWDEFLELAHADVSAFSRVSDAIPYTYARVGTGSAVWEPHAGEGEPVSVENEAGVRATYRATRLLFRRDVIEPLHDDEAFRVITPAGTFQMTKAEFARVFRNVRESVSYRERRVYHYRMPPKAALQFLVTRRESADIMETANASCSERDRELGKRSPSPESAQRLRD